MTSRSTNKQTIREVQELCAELGITVLDYSYTGHQHHRFQLRLADGTTRLLIASGTSRSTTGRMNRDSQIKRWAREAENNLKAVPMLASPHRNNERKQP